MTATPVLPSLFGETGTIVPFETFVQYFAQTCGGPNKHQPIDGRAVCEGVVQSLTPATASAPDVSREDSTPADDFVSQF